jgi:anti-sigma factor RsiW
MTCRVHEDELSAYLDGELPAARRARLEAHLRVCPHCQGELQELSGISRYIRAASQQLRVSQEFDQRVLRAVTSYQVAARVQRQQRSLLRPLIAIAIVLLALLGMAQHFLFQRPPSPLPQPSAAGAMVSPAAPAPTAPDEKGRR